ncbi:(2Fe-2S)-binding protein [Alkalilacustris brevis]|uniref:(2Fe-2S)-binding protein n=1 Tax=Alkalilacustris brevis TaxID=2026338 RepID=UPI000E0D492D|nr:(2Fe-2S)-binding protein [Alkalilacustris brevis]
MSAPVQITLSINGEPITATVAPRMMLVDFLREVAALTGTHLGCAHGVCGACTVRLDGASVRSCLMLAVQAEGTEIETIEGLADSGAEADLLDAFHRHNAVQCGYCSSGMLVSAAELLAQGGVPDRATIRDHISGNYCRCTGYQSIVDAVEEVARTRAGKAGAGA